MSQKKRNSDVNCDVVQDLLPLYHDGVVKDGTRKIVEAHLEDCEVCSREYANLCEELPIPIEEPSTRKKFLKTIRSSRRKRTVITVLAVLAVLLCTKFVYDYCYTHITEELSPEDVKIGCRYRWKGLDGKYQDVFIYAVKDYGFQTETLDTYEENGQLIAEYHLWKSKLAKKKDSYEFHEYSGWTGGDNYDPDKIIYGGHVVWERDQNADDPIPEFAELYADQNLQNCEWHTSVEGNWAEVTFPDGTKKRWDLQGKEISVPGTYQVPKH